MPVAPMAQSPLAQSPGFPDPGRSPGLELSDSPSVGVGGGRRRSRSNPLPVVLAVVGGLGGLGLILVLAMSGSGPAPTPPTQGTSPDRQQTAVPSTPRDPVERPRRPRPRPMPTPPIEPDGPSMPAPPEPSETALYPWPGQFVGGQPSGTPDERQVRAIRVSDSAGVVAASFGPLPGEALAVCWDGQVAWYNLDSGEELFRYDNDLRAVAAAAFSPDGSRLAIGRADGTVQLYDVAFDGLELLADWFPQPSIVSSVWVGNAEPRVWTANEDNLLLMLTPDNREPVLEHQLRRGRVARAMAASPRARGLALGTADRVRWLELGRGSMEDRPWLRESPRSLAFDPSGQHLAVGGQDGTLWVLRVGEEQPVATLTGAGDAITAVRYLPQGNRVLTGCGGRYEPPEGWVAARESLVRLWDVERGEAIAEFRGHAEAVTSLDVWSDGRRALSSSIDGTIRVWDLSPYSDPATGPAETPSPSPSPGQTPGSERRLGTSTPPTVLAVIRPLDPTALGASIEVLPETSDSTETVSVPDYPGPAAEWLEGFADQRQPLPLMTEEDVASFDREFGERVREANRDAYSDLARELLDAAKIVEDGRPSLARYLALRAFALAALAGRQGEVGLARQAYDLFNRTSKSAEPDQRLAVALARIKMIERLQILLRRTDPGGAGSLDRPWVETMLDAAEQLARYAYFDRARVLASSAQLGRTVSQLTIAALKQRHDELRQAILQKLDERNRFTEALMAFDEESNAEAATQLAAIVVGRLGNLQAAVKLLELSSDPRHRQVVAFVRQSQQEPQALLALAEAFAGLAEAQEGASATGFWLIAGNAAARYLAEVNPSAESEERVQAEGIRNTAQTRFEAAPALVGQ